MRNVAGEDILALGSDSDGMDSRLEWTDAAGNRIIEEKLNTVFSADLVDKITHKNALRVFESVIG